jgi:hypothetical protein
MRYCLLVLLLFLSGFAAQAQAAKESADAAQNTAASSVTQKEPSTSAKKEPLASNKNPSDSSKESPSDVRIAMNRLAKAALEQSLKIMYEKHEQIYPFALLQYDSGRIDAITYKQTKDKNGKPETPPSAEEWAAHVFVHLQKLVLTEPTLDYALLSRMDTMKDKQGKAVMGVWVEVDGRHALRPWVVFLPLVKQKDGKYKQGNPLYYATDQSIFPHADLKTDKAPARKKHK